MFCADAGGAAGEQCAGCLTALRALRVRISGPTIVAKPVAVVAGAAVPALPWGAGAFQFGSLEALRLPGQTVLQRSGSPSKPGYQVISVTSGYHCAAAGATASSTPSTAKPCRMLVNIVPRRASQTHLQACITDSEQTLTRQHSRHPYLGTCIGHQPWLSTSLQRS